MLSCALFLNINCLARMWTCRRATVTTTTKGRPVLCHRRKIMVVAILTKSSYWEFYPKGIHSNPSTHPDTQLLFPKNQTTTLTTQH
ncbi:hypothetical protein VTJ04DRAFT_6015 [Mycothermus thermophilus]|uniref:uncharacterized protein n=1 Tax=Humicola insolens TaxID=85995 RepID=UPI003744491F